MRMPRRTVQALVSSKEVNLPSSRYSAFRSQIIIAEGEKSVHVNDTSEQGGFGTGLMKN